MKRKSLRQLAKELGVSASYLSQVRHGKRPASDKLINVFRNLSVKRKFDVGTTINYNSAQAGVAELADAADLKSAGLGPCGFESHPRH